MSQTMICSNCRTDEYLKQKSITDEFEVKGEKTPYTYAVLECQNCGELVSTPEQNDEILKGVYDTYKAKHGLLSTDDIIAIRDHYGLSLRDFSKILGVSHITYHRYEKGAIPDPALNNLLLLVQDHPENLLKLYHRVKDSFAPTAQQKIEKKLEMSLSKRKSEKERKRHKSSKHPVLT